MISGAGIRHISPFNFCTIVQFLLCSLAFETFWIKPLFLYFVFLLCILIVFSIIINSAFESGSFACYVSFFVLKCLGFVCAYGPPLVLVKNLHISPDVLIVSLGTNVRPYKSNSWKSKNIKNDQNRGIQFSADHWF